MAEATTESVRDDALVDGIRRDTRPEGQNATEAWALAFEDDELQRWAFENSLEFALAGRNSRGWPVMALTDHAGTAFHVMLVDPRSGLFVDVAGPVHLSEVAERYRGGVVARPLPAPTLTALGWSVDEDAVQDAEALLKGFAGHPLVE